MICKTSHLYKIGVIYLVSLLISTVVFDRTVINVVQFLSLNEWLYQIKSINYTSNLISWNHCSIVGSVVECSPATRAARVRFPDDAVIFKWLLFLSLNKFMLFSLEQGVLNLLVLAYPQIKTLLLGVPSNQNCSPFAYPQIKTLPN